MTTLLTISDVATRLAVSERTVKRLAQARLLRRVKVGRATRFNESNVEQFIERPSSRPAPRPANFKPRPPRAQATTGGCGEASTQHNP